MIEPTDTPLLKDILAEPASLAQAVEHQFGPGRRALADAASAIRKAGFVYLTGMGGSFTPCIQLSYQLGARGVAAVTVESAELLHYLSALGRNATVVMVSRSGDTVEVAKLIPLLKEQGAVIIGVTNDLNGMLSREADHTIFVNSRPDDSVALQTYVCTVATLLLLGAAVLEEPFDRWRREFDGLVNAIEGALPDLVAASELWKPFLERAGTIYLLGRGPSYGSAIEGGMMLNEMARASAVGMSAGNFRHGAVEMVDERFRAIVFASQPRTRNLDLALAAELRRFGGQVQVVGSGTGSSAAADLPFWRIPRLSDSLSPIAEIVPVQLAGFRLAQWRGLPLGEFRFITVVTTDEERLIADGQSRL